MKILAFSDLHLARKAAAVLVAESHALPLVTVEIAANLLAG